MTAIGARREGQAEQRPERSFERSFARSGWKFAKKDISLRKRGALSPQKAPRTVDSTLMGLIIGVTIDILVGVGFIESAGKYYAVSRRKKASFTEA